MRITVTAKGEFERYIQEQMQATGMSAGSTVAMLAIQGMEQKKAVSGLEAFTRALNASNQAQGKAPTETP